jgi:hypothetical protein
MPTVETYYIDPDTGGSPARDYADLATAEGAQQQNLVTADVHMFFVMRSTSGTADTSVPDVNGWTMDATRKLTIDATGQYHGGKWNANTYRLERSWSAHLFEVTESFVEVLGMQVNNTHDTGTCYWASASGSGEPITYDRCIAKTTSSAKQGIGFETTGSWLSGRYKNCLAYDFSGSGGSGWYLASGNQDYLHFCNAIDCDNGFNEAGSGTPIVKCCLAQNCTDGFVGSFHANSDYNCSDIASDAPGGNSVTGSPTFVNEAADDFHLATGDTVCKDKGTDLSGEAILPVSTDVDGDSRPQGSQEDIGFDEVLSAAVEARITALDAAITYTEILARITAVDADLTYSEIAARITAMDAGLTYGEISGRITAVDADLTYTELAFIVTAMVHEIECAARFDVEIDLAARFVTEIDLLGRFEVEEDLDGRIG